MIPPSLTLSDIRYVSKVKWSNPGKGVAPSPTPWCSSYWKRSLLVALDYGCQLYLLTIRLIENFKNKKEIDDSLVKNKTKFFSDKNTSELNTLFEKLWNIKLKEKKQQKQPLPQTKTSLKKYTGKWKYNNKRSRQEKHHSQIKHITE